MNEYWRIEDIYKLFDAVRAVIDLSCGDGDGWIVSSKYKELADLFEAYEQKTYKFFNNRCDVGNTVGFGGDQACFGFAKSRDDLYRFGDILVGDIIVELVDGLI